MLVSQQNEMTVMFKLLLPEFAPFCGKQELAHY